MIKPTKRIEQLLAGSKASLKLVREEITAGASLQHVYDELSAHERIFSTRLKELKEFNEADEENTRRADEEKAKADRAAKLETVRKELLAMPREQLIKEAIGNKAVIEIKDDTTIEAIVDAILKTAPENI